MRVWRTLAFVVLAGITIASVHVEESVSALPRTYAASYFDPRGAQDLTFALPEMPYL
jgi:hypothetical protein